MAGEMDPKAAEELAKSVQGLRESTEATTKSFNEQLKIIMQMRDVMSKMAGTMGEIGNMPSGPFDAEYLRDVEKSTRDVNAAQEASNAVLKKYADRTATAVSVMTGLRQGFKNLVALGKGVFNLFMSVADGLWSVTKAIIAVPFKMMQGLFKMANQGGGDTSYAQALENIRKEYGSLQSDSAMAIKTAARDLRTLDLGGISTTRIFGNAAQQLEAITKMAQGMGASFQVFGDEVMKNGAAMAAYNKGLGITDEMMSGIASNAMRMGKGITDIQNDMTKQALGMSKAFGVNAKVISRDMGKAMQDLAHFGHLSTNELAIAATFANKLGVSVDKLTGIMDATSTYDQAAEGMSKLNEQYGTNIDATEIMSAQNPAEKLEILRKEFAKTGKDMSQLTYQDRMLIKQTSGLTDELMNAAFSAKNANVNLSDIQKQGAKNERKTLSQAEAMNKLADSMERIVQSGQGEGGIFAHFLDGMKRGMMASPEFMKLMTNIRHVFYIATQAGVKLGRMFVDLFPGVKDVFGGMGKLFDPKRWSNMFAEVTKAFNVFKVGGSGNIEDFIERIKTAFSNFFAGGKGGSQQVVEGFKKFGKTVVAVLVEIGKWTWKELKEMYHSFTNEMENPGPTTLKVKKFFEDVISSLSKFLTEKAIPFARDAIKTLTYWLTDKDKFKEGIPAAGGLAKMMGEIFGPLGQALKVAWQELYPALRDLAIELMFKLKDGLWESVKAVWNAASWDQILAFATVQFGPTLAGLLFKSWVTSKAEAAFMSKMTESIEGSISNSLGTAGNSPGVQKAGAEAAEGIMSKLFPSFSKIGPSIAGYLGQSIGGSGFIGTITAGVAAAPFAVVGSALAGAFFGQHLVDSWHDASVEAGEKMNAASEEFYEKLSKENDPSKIMKSLKKEQDEAFKANKEAGSMWSRFTDQFYGTGDEQRAAAARLDQVNEQIKKQANKSIVGTAEYIREQKRIQEEKDKEAEKRQLDALGPVTIENAAERFKKIDELAKKVMDKGFDIKDKLKAVHDKLAGISFSIVDSGKEEEINKAFLQMQKIQGIFANLADVGGLAGLAVDRMSKITDVNATKAFEKLQNAIVNAIKAVTTSGTEIGETNLGHYLSLTEVWSPKISKMFNDLSGTSTSISDFVTSSGKYTEAIVTTSLTKTQNTVTKMVAAVQSMDNALAKLGTINIGTRLNTVAKSLGIGSSGTYTVQSKEVVINVNFTIQMDAGKVEKAMLMNTESIIKDRINFALGGGQGKNAVVAESLKPNMSYAPVATNVK